MTLADEQRDTLRLALGYIGSSDRADRMIHVARIRELLGVEAADPAMVAPEQIGVQEAWEAAGGNPGIKATREQLVTALKMLDGSNEDADLLGDLVRDAMGHLYAGQVGLARACLARATEVTFTGAAKASAEAQPSDAVQAPIYQTKLKGADGWRDCDLETFEHNAKHPTRFDTRIESPGAWMYTMRMPDGRTQVRFERGFMTPFGVAGEDYPEENHVTCAVVPPGDEPVKLEFGFGKVAVMTGSFDGAAAVILVPADRPELQALNAQRAPALQVKDISHGVVLTFPLPEQAERVADVLTRKVSRGAAARPHAPVLTDEMRLSIENAILALDQGVAPGSEHANDLRFVLAELDGRAMVVRAAAGDPVAYIVSGPGGDGLAWAKDLHHVRADLTRTPLCHCRGGESQAHSDERERRHYNPIYNTDPVQRACGELPEGWEIRISLEKDAGTIDVYDPTGNNIDFESDADHFDWRIHEAIDTVLQPDFGEVSK